MRRPSQFMLLFLIMVGTPLFLWGEKPRPVQLGKANGARLLDRGRGDFAAPAVEVTPAARTSDEGTVADVDEPAKGPWTLFGRVLREVWTAKGSQPGDEAASVGLELIPLGSGRHASNALLSTVTSANGSFAWAGLYPGSYRLRALPDRESSSHLPVAIDVELPATDSMPGKDGRLQQDLLLPVPMVLRGSLRTRSDEPRAGLTVSVSETGMHRGTTVSDENGGFHIQGVGKGPYQIQVRTGEGASIPVESVVTASRPPKDRSVELAVLIP